MSKNLSFRGILSNVLSFLIRLRKDDWLHPLIILIVCGSVIDVLSYVTRDGMSLSLSAIIRTMLLAVMFIHFARSPSSRPKRIATLVLLSSVIFFALQLLFVNYGSHLDLIYQILRMWFFPLLLIMLLGSKKLNYKIIPRAILLSVLAYAFVIVLAMVLGVSLYAHNNPFTVSGAVGWFYSANEVGAILVAGASLAIIHISKTRSHTRFYHYLPALIIVVIPIVGTKLATFGYIAVLFSLFMYKLARRGASGLSFYGLSICAVIFTLSIIAAPTLQNFAVRNVEQNIAVSPVGDEVQAKRTITNSSNSGSATSRVVSFVRSNIFSGRIYFLEQRAAEYARGDLARSVLGRGDYSNESRVRTVEMDIFDILFANGVIGFLLYMSIVSWPIVLALRSRPPDGFRGTQSFVLKSSLILLILISAVAGHIIVAPAVSVMMVGVIYFLISQNYREGVIA